MRGCETAGADSGLEEGEIPAGVGGGAGPRAFRDEAEGVVAVRDCVDCGGDGRVAGLDVEREISRTGLALIDGGPGAGVAGGVALGAVGAASVGHFEEGGIAVGSEGGGEPVRECQQRDEPKLIFHQLFQYK